MGKFDGELASGARVKYTFDSVNQEKYFISKTTNDSGLVIFDSLPVSTITRKKTYYANPTYTVNGDTFSSTNGNGSNGPVGFELFRNAAINRQLIVTRK